jgi:hypothetical protein
MRRSGRSVLERPAGTRHAARTHAKRSGERYDFFLSRPDEKNRTRVFG